MVFRAIGGQETKTNLFMFDREEYELNHDLECKSDQIKSIYVYAIVQKYSDNIMKVLNQQHNKVIHLDGFIKIHMKTHEEWSFSAVPPRLSM